MTNLADTARRYGDRTAINLDATEIRCRGLDDAASSATSTQFVDRVRRALLSSGRAQSPRCMTAECDCAFGRDMARPFPQERVRLTSIYSKGDGVIRWQAAVVPYGDCVEVTGSHAGLIVNREAYRAVAAALAKPELP